MAFVPKKFDSGKVLSLPVKASEAVVKHTHTKFASGYLANGAAGDNEAEYIALETITGGASDGTVKCMVLPIDDVTEFEALTATTPVQATHVGTSVDFTDATKLDLTATTDKVFHIDSIKNATDKIVRGHFNKPAIA